MDALRYARPRPRSCLALPPWRCPLTAGKPRAASEPLLLRNACGLPPARYLLYRPLTTARAQPAFFWPFPELSTARRDFHDHKLSA
jgi:hypothetical protein